MEEQTNTITSRRSRPAKEPLSKEIIVKTAYDLLESEGISGLSMRKIAKVLDTGPSSLYVYVKNADELRAYVLDYGLGKIEITDEKNEPWKKELFTLVYSYFRILFDSSGMAELALMTIPIGPNSLALTEQILCQLHEGGVNARASAWGVDILLLYAASVAYEQTARKEKGTTLDPIRASYEALDTARYPMIVSLKENMLSGGEERFRWGLEVVLQGILHTQ
ncbi:MULTISPECIES: TetR/AcrR family transcriptional regulator [Bacillus cereus group]|uniref:TetR/AcrR family transcriptional regulator n=1 Tax=Bacillus cereus group TaxID=86661 RepID=UPI000993E574|nr:MULTISPECIES: TetR/AcrR family transcriptional regulator [Bacillus cereus group]OOR15673.1 TetR family transcriptional regulator [Bacillus mycoides]QWG76549.1 TetR/AcrR family transcriptional regulator [Bacillus mycoides]TXR71621.1 TetR/AcrR family transcriptional regulator [Bacillus sp. AR13-1]